MKHDGSDEENASEHESAVQNKQNGPEDERGCDGAGMKILVKDVEGRPSHGQSEERAYQGNTGPVSGRRGEATPGQSPASPEQKKCRQALSDHFGDRDGNVCEMNPGGHDPIKDAGLHLHCEQPEIVGVERGVKAALDRGEIHRIVLDSGMISFHEQRRGADRCEQDEVPGLGATFQGLSASLKKRMESRVMTTPRSVRSGETANLCEDNPRIPALALVIPTLREAKNIRPLLSRVRAALDPYDLAYEVIVVDDESQDGIDEIVADLACKDPRIRLIVRTSERGLAGAVLRGWAESDAALLAVMDADLQHPPELLPKLWEELDRGADLVVGSRYACGGCMRGWKLVRQLISRVAVWMTLPVQRSGIRARDPMSGFFMIRRSCIERLELQKSGFKILLEILARAEIRNVVEVPFSFGRRHAGASKANLRVAFDYFSLLVRLCRQRGRTPTLAERDIARSSLRRGQEAA